MDIMRINQSYNIVATFNGGSSSQTLITRKRKDFEEEVDELYENSDFKNRHATYLGKKLKDNNKSRNFCIDPDPKDPNGLVYRDDHEGEVFEIFTGEDNHRYGVWLFSLYHVSQSFDDELMLGEQEIGLTIYPEFTRDNSIFGHYMAMKNFWWYCSAIVSVTSIFFVYRCVLPAHIRDRVLGLDPTDRLAPAAAAKVE